MSLRVIFAGTPQFAVPALQSLLNSSHQVVAVYTQPDRRAGRGRQMMASAIKQLALERHIKVYQPQTLRDTSEQKELLALQGDVMVVVAYGLLLPVTVLNTPRLGCLNVHASLLPRWRGAAPIQHAILAGDTKTGVSIMQMDAGLDTGDILAQQSCPILATDSSADLYGRLSQLGAELLLNTLGDLVANRVKLIQQDDNKATLAPKIQKKDAKLDWKRSAIDLVRWVNAFNPAPVAFTFYNKQPLRIWAAQALPESHQLKPGTLIRASREGIDVATAQGLLRLQQVQMPGKRIQSAADFFNAQRNALIPQQTIFGE